MHLLILPCPECCNDEKNGLLERDWIVEENGKFFFCCKNLGKRCKNIYIFRFTQLISSGKKGEMARNFLQYPVGQQSGPMFCHTFSHWKIIDSRAL
jgi:hypothetical protein